MLNGRVMIIRSIIALTKKTLYKMSQYFPKHFLNDWFGGNVKVELDLSKYTTKADLKGATWIDTSNLALKSNLANLKAGVDKKDVGKLKTLPVDLSKWSNVVNNEVVKKTVYDTLAAKVNNTYTSGFALKAK